MKFSATFHFYVFKTKWSNLIRIPDCTEQMHIIFFSSPSHHLASINHPTPRSNNILSWKWSGLVCCCWFFSWGISAECLQQQLICQKVKRVKSELEAGKLNRSPLLPFHSCVEIPSVSVKQGLDTMETQNLWRQTSTEKNPEIYTECWWNISCQRMAFLPQWISLCKNKVICSKWKCFTCM